MTLKTPGGVNSLEAHWMPFTANRDFKHHPRLVTKSQGMYLWDINGAKIIDGSSGLFTCAAGHSRKEIADAVYAQMVENCYIPHFQLGVPNSFVFAQRLTQLLPDPLNRIFFCCSGSEAIDSALKIIMAVHKARGQVERRVFVSRARAYHGVNIGGVSLSGIAANRKDFQSTMPGVVHLRHTWNKDNRFVRGQPETGAELANDLVRFCELYGAGAIAAVFVEPIAGSTGVLVPPKGYLERLREICDHYGIILVFDEVICGFGRLGAPFAIQAFGVKPDIVIMAKGLTNGAMPMGAVALRDDLYQAVIDSASPNTIELFHGYTYSGHPAACAAGLACLDIYQNENLFDQANQLSSYFLDAVWSLKDHPMIYDLRGFGLLAGFQVKSEAVSGARGTKLQKALFDNGLHIKFTGDSGIIAPALIAQEHHIDEILVKLIKTLDQI